jgi:hypothetical protein
MAIVTRKTAIKNLMVSSASSLTLSDRRLYNYLLSHAFDGLAKQLDFEIELTDLIGIYGTGMPPIERLKESLRRLLRTLIEFETGDEQWVVMSLLEKAEFDERGSRLFYSYSIYSRRLFLDSITLEKCLIQAHFTQKYSNFLYEILASAHYAGEERLVIEIADLRSALHVPFNKLANYSDFDRFVLIPASKEINSHASFATKYHTDRKGMKVTHVVFEMTAKRNVATESAIEIIPPKRPRLFIDDPQVEAAYAYLLNAETKIRRKYFDMACKRAVKNKEEIHESVFDRPDLWFRWVERALIKIMS